MQILQYLMINGRSIDACQSGSEGLKHIREKVDVFLLLWEIVGVDLSPTKEGPIKFEVLRVALLDEKRRCGCRLLPV